MDLGIVGRTDIVTGGSAGIGLGTIARLASEGANAVAAARRAEHLDQALRSVDPSGERTLAIAQDMTAIDAAQRLHDADLERFGQIDGIVNNVGTSLRGAFTDLTDELWLEDMDFKLFPAIRLIQTAMPESTARGVGSVVSVLSIGGKQPGAGTLPTSMTRSAGLALTKAVQGTRSRRHPRQRGLCRHHPQRAARPTPRRAGADDER